MEKKTAKRIVELRKGTSTIKLYIPKDVEAKIRFLCEKIHTIEWSGVLFYKYIGSFEDDSLQLICQDIYLKDIGSSTYTQFDDNPDILDYRISHDLLDPSIQEGLIHSHNTFAAFFSGTDTQTLKEEGEASNHFLSLIVNNEGQYVARITKKIITDTEAEAHIKYNESQHYSTYGNNKVTVFENVERTEDKEKSFSNCIVEYYDLDIIKEEAESQGDTELEERIQEIQRQNANRYTKYVRYDSTDYPYNNYYQGSYNYYQPWYKELPKQEGKVIGDEKIRSIIISLLTGSIFTSGRNISNALVRADELYTRKFGNLSIEKNLADADNFISTFLGYLLDIPNSDDAAIAIYDFLTSSEIQSNIKDLILSNLTLYLPYGAEEYQ